MLGLVIYDAKDDVIMFSLPHVTCWEHGVEGGQAVTTKDRARGGARNLFCNMHVFFTLGTEGGQG